eukprot:jgi/Chlat1/8427/Chrsp80S07920
MEAAVAVVAGKEEADGKGAQVPKEEPVVPRVLLTNDDGIFSPGLAAVLDGLRAAGGCEVLVCAPDRERSAVSHCIELHRPLEIAPVSLFEDVEAYECTGNPADCVMLGLSGQLFSGRRPDLVISGMNRGSNAGMNIIYSGTVGGAREALVGRVPAIALSLDSLSRKADYAPAVEACMPIIKAAMQSVSEDTSGPVFPKDCLINVNVPHLPRDQIKGVRYTRQGLAQIIPRFVELPVDDDSKKEARVEDSNDANYAKQTKLGDELPPQQHRSGKRLRPDSEHAEQVALSKRRRFRHEVAAFVDDADKSLDLDSYAVSQGWVSVSPIGLLTHVPAPSLLAAETWFKFATSAANGPTLAQLFQVDAAQP